MEVTRHNFSEAFEAIEKHFKSCCLVAFDAEFTSLPSHEAIKPRLFDDGSERYNRMRPAVSTALITQVGLTMYTYERDISAYRAHTYTFHLRPQAVAGIDQTFRFQASTLEFLCRHSFDFNKFIYDGIPYLSRAEVSRLTELQERRELEDALLRSLEMFQEHELQEKCSAVSQWLINKDESTDTLYIEPSSPVMRYLLHTEIRTRFPDVLTADSLGTSDMVAVYRNVYVDGAHGSPQEALLSRLMRELLGFSRVVELLASCRKPLVGHNVYFDLVLLHNQFIGPVPKSYAQFKRNVNQFATEVYDTKHIAATLSRKLSFDEVWKSTALQDLYEFVKEDKCKRLQSSVMILPSQEFQLHQTYHEAGWDSYCAGYILLRLGNWMAKEAGGKGATGPTQTLAALLPHKNKVNLMRCAVQYMNLEGDDAPRHRPPLMHVLALKQHINISKVAALLSGYGTVDVQAYGNRAALVAPATHHTAEKILKNFKSAEYRISTYSVYRHSPFARVALWSGAILTGGAVLMLVQHRMRS